MPDGQPFVPALRYTLTRTTSKPLLGPPFYVLCFCDTTWIVSYNLLHAPVPNWGFL